MTKLECAYDAAGVPSEVLREYEEELGQVIRRFVEKFRDETDINVMLAAITVIARGVEFERALYVMSFRESASGLAPLGGSHLFTQHATENFFCTDCGCACDGMSWHADKVLCNKCFDTHCKPGSAV